MSGEAPWTMSGTESESKDMALNHDINNTYPGNGPPLNHDTNSYPGNVLEGQHSQENGVCGADGVVPEVWTGAQGNPYPGVVSHQLYIFETQQSLFMDAFYHETMT